MTSRLLSLPSSQPAPAAHPLPSPPFADPAALRSFIDALYRCEDLGLLWQAAAWTADMLHAMKDQAGRVGVVLPAVVRQAEAECSRFAYEVSVYQHKQQPQHSRT